MNIENIVLARKLSVLEYDALKQKISFEQALKQTKALGVNGEAVLASHENQKQSFKTVLQALNRYNLNPGLVVGDIVNYRHGKELFKTSKKPNSLVVASGGDGYYQHISHFVDGGFILGLNADPDFSEGATLEFTAETFVESLPKILEGHFNFEEWTRLHAKVQGRNMRINAISEIYYGAIDRRDISRYIIELGDQKEEQKGSGIIIATGTGSTGWYHAEASCPHEEAGTFPRREHKATIYPTSTFETRRSGHYQIPDLELKLGDVLKLTYLAHQPGVLSIDSKSRGGQVINSGLRRGSIATVEISDQLLRVVIP